MVADLMLKVAGVVLIGFGLYQIISGVRGIITKIKENREFKKVMNEAKKST